MGRLQRKPTNANSSKRTRSDIKIQETDSKLKSLLVIPPNDTNTIDIIQQTEQEVHTTTETNQIIADFEIFQNNILDRLDLDSQRYYRDNKMEYNERQYGYLDTLQKVTLGRQFRSANKELLQFLLVANEMSVANKMSVPQEYWPKPRSDMESYILADNGLKSWHEDMKKFSDAAIENARKAGSFKYNGVTYNKGNNKAEVLIIGLWGSSCDGKAAINEEDPYSHHYWTFKEGTSLVVDLLAQDLHTQVWSISSAFGTNSKGPINSSEGSKKSMAYWLPRLSESRTSVSLQVKEDNFKVLKPKKFATAAIIWAAVSKAYHNGSEYPFFGCQQEHRIGIATKVGDNAPCCKMMNLLARDKSHAEGPFASAIDLGNKENWIENMDNSKTEAKLATEHAIAAKKAKAKLATKNAKAASVKSNAKAANAKAANAKAARVKSNAKAAKAARVKSKATPVKHQR